ncbi:hypothetical protein GP480_02120 [Neorickettsia findlayensis]|uniref:PD-(D/E)XK endonuclease-like domain-containing protein n=2 Tax=Neorickettsia findlayensis TaxID=2686014 RepID=A0A6P1GAJ8_9RICK|nr:hypothetical protein GP480_02120 [Neorickettsia findlayensis]
MLYNLHIKSSIYDAIVSYLCSREDTPGDYSHCLVLTPNYSFSYSLKKSFSKPSILPKIVSLDTIFRDFAIKNSYFEYLNFSKKAVLTLYSLMKNEKHCSIDEAMFLFTYFQQGEVEHNDFIHNEIYKKFTYYHEYKKFQELALDLTFRDYKEVIVAGIYITDEISRYIYEKAVANNCPIFIYGLEPTYKAAPEHFLYHTLKFQKEKDLEIISLGKDRAISQLNTNPDPNFFPGTKESKQKPQVRYNLLFYEMSNEHHMVKSAVTYLTDFYPDVALVTANYCLLKKVGAILSKENINLIFKEKYTAHPDGIFLLTLLDTAILGESDISFIALLKHPYIYEENSDIIDCIEDSTIRTTKSKQITQEARLFLENIKRWSKGFHHAKNFAEYHIKWSDAITNRLTSEGKRILEFIKKHSPRFTDIYEYRQILLFFLERQYFYPLTDNKRIVNVFSPKEASFLAYRNIVLLDCTEEDFQIRDPLIMLNIFHTLSTKKSIVIFNKEKPLSRLFLQIRHSCADNCEIKKELTQPKETVAVIAKEKLFVPIEMLPKKLSPTMIELLMNDPYKFYLRYILAIKETNSMLVKPGHKEFGYIMHKVFQAANKTYFSKEEYTRILEDELKIYSTRYRYVKNLWLPRGLKILEQFATFHNERLEEIDKLENEKELSIFIADGLELFCRFDRIESLKDGTVNIVEFKTGTIPTFKEISSLAKPQLPLQGVILEKNRNVRFNAMMYCKPSTEKVIVKKLQSPEETIAETHTKLKILAQIYLSGGFDFLSNIMKN